MPRSLSLRYRGSTVSSIVFVRRGALSELGRAIRRHAPARRAVVVTDRRVAELHGGAAMRSLRRAGITARRIDVPRGERAKQPAQLLRLWDAFAAMGIERGDLVVALGGGV